MTPKESSDPVTRPAHRTGLPLDPSVTTHVAQHHTDTALACPLDGYPAEKALPYETTTARIIAFCAEEVRRQQDSPWHVFRMVEAWWFALERHAIEESLSHGLLRELGRLVDEANTDGYRSTGVRVGGRTAMSPPEIHPAMSELIAEQGRVEPWEWYGRFEIIHPFADGNGRVGKVLFNWLRGSLDDPVWPRSHWGDIENP